MIGAPCQSSSLLTRTRTVSSRQIRQRGSLRSKSAHTVSVALVIVLTAQGLRLVVGLDRRDVADRSEPLLIDGAVAEQESVVLPGGIRGLLGLDPNPDHHLATIAEGVVDLIPGAIVGGPVTHRAQRAGIEGLPNVEEVLLQAHRLVRVEPT